MLDDGDRTRAGAVGPRAAWREVLREDVRAHNGDLTSPGLHAVLVHRFGAARPSMPRSVRPLAQLVHRVAYLAVRNVYGIELPRTVQLGRRVRLAHQSGVVIHPLAVIGDDCVLRQNVTLGAGSGSPESFARQAPRLGARVSVGAGAVIVGGVRIGDGARIGPNATVLTHVPAGATVLAPANRVLRRAEPAS